jgi:hypothetical protein
MKINHNRDQQNKYYSYCDYADYIDEDNKPRIKEEQDYRVLAKVLHKSNLKKYYIRLSSNKKFFDPKTFDINKKINLEQKQMLNKFKQVSGKVFNLYINFLTSKNNAWLLNAEREDE